VRSCPFGLLSPFFFSPYSYYEEDIELMNALLGRFCHAHQVADIETYVHVSGLLGGLHQLTVELDARAFRRIGKCRKNKTSPIGILEALHYYYCKARRSWPAREDSSTRELASPKLGSAHTAHCSQL
jgi:hypothetical protein